MSNNVVQGTVANGSKGESKEEQIQRILAENARLKAMLNGKVKSLKVSEKGGLSVYGLGRFPVTLYAGQWRALIDAIPQIQQFLKDHASELKEKGE